MSTSTLVNAEHAVGPTDCSTSFSFYAVSPESPDGTQIAYIRFKTPPIADNKVQPAELWVCKRDLSDHRMIADIGNSYTHNGATVIWVTNDRLILQAGDPQPTGSKLQVYDISRGELAFEPFHISQFGPTLFDDNFIFWVWEQHAELCGREAGAYLFNYLTGAIEPLFSMKDLDGFVEQRPMKYFADVETLPTEQWRLFHIKFSPNGQILAFRLDFFKVASGGCHSLCFYDRKTMKFSWFNGLRPNHYFWYDNESVAGHDVMPENQPFRRIRRFKLNGEYIEDLGPSGIHCAPSPDFSHFASDSIWQERRGVFISAKGDHIPHFVCDSTEHFYPVVREAHFHENPSFSRDGRRVYYHRPHNGVLNGTFYFDLDEAGGYPEADDFIVSLANKKLA